MVKINIYSPKSYSSFCGGEKKKNHTYISKAPLNLLVDMWPSDSGIREVTHSSSRFRGPGRGPELFQLFGVQEDPNIFLWKLFHDLS